MLRTLFSRRTGRALCAVSIGVATMGATVAATTTAAWAKAKPVPVCTSVAPTPPGTGNPAPEPLTTAGGSVTITGTGLTFTGYTTTVTFNTTTGIAYSGTATSGTFTAPAESASAGYSVTVVEKKGTKTVSSNACSIEVVGTFYEPPASLIIGSGSETTYDVMDHLGDIFEESPGCDLTNTTVNQYDLQCSTALGTSNDLADGGEAGLPVGNVNPLDDYYANAPGTGSGNGRGQTLNAAPSGDPVNPLLGGPDGIAAFNTSFARSSSKSVNADLNYVGYATDGVSWVSEACIGITTPGDCKNPHPYNPPASPTVNQTFPAGATPHWDVTDISKANLQAIWNNTEGCNLDNGSPLPSDGTGVTMDWRCLELAEGVQTPASLIANGEGFSGPAEPIDCYTTQTASGTYSTWEGYLTFGNPPACASNEASGTVTSHTNLTENSMGWVDTQPDAEWAIYFFSYGKFTQTCQQVSTSTQTFTPTGDTGGPAQIQGNCIGQSASNVTQYGSINGIYADAQTIQGTGDDSGVTFPDPRILYNVYADTAAPNPANAATLNFIGAGGFLCRADLATTVDPNTGAFYRTEIENAIYGDGFFPLDTSLTDTFTEPTLTLVPSAAATAKWYPADASQTGGQKGYCTTVNN
jgi:hypothetical protein